MTQSVCDIHDRWLTRMDWSSLFSLPDDFIVNNLLFILFIAFTSLMPGERDFIRHSATRLYMGPYIPGFRIYGVQTKRWEIATTVL